MNTCNRDEEAVTAVLQQLRQTAASDQNLTPAMMTAVRAYATIGEITQVLKAVFGEFREPIIL